MNLSLEVHCYFRTKPATGLIIMKQGKSTMAKTSLPPGFRFHPTDVELVWYYLKRKILGKSFRFEAISEVELYKFAPWDLPDKSCLRSRDLEWFFFCPRDRKYANGTRTNRATETGYWKTTGKDRPIDHNSQTVGMKKTLIFHLGKAPKGTRTDWVMYEFRLQSKELVNAGFQQDAFVLCKIFQKSGPGPKNGEQYGAPFDEEDWDDVSDNEHTVSLPCFPCQEQLNDQSFLSDHVQMQPVTFEVGEPSSMLDFSEARVLNSMPVQSVTSDVVEPSMEIIEVGELQSVPELSYGDGLSLEELRQYLNASPPRQEIANDEMLLSEFLHEDIKGVLDEDIETVYAQLNDLFGQQGIGPDDLFGQPGIGPDDLYGQQGIGLDDFAFHDIMVCDNELHPLSEVADEHFAELSVTNWQTRYQFANNSSFPSAQNSFELAKHNGIHYPLNNNSTFLSANDHFGLASHNGVQYPFATNSGYQDTSSIFVGNPVPTPVVRADEGVNDILPSTSDVPLWPPYLFPGQKNPPS